jgi:hypothetical protein
VSEAAPEEAGLPEGPRLALAAPEDDVRPLVVGEGSAVHTVPVGLALARGVLEELATEDRVLCAVLLTHALGVAQLEEEGLTETRGEREPAALALAGGLRVALAQIVAGADGLALAEGDWDAAALAVRAGEGVGCSDEAALAVRAGKGVGCGDEVAVADAEGAEEARGVSLREALLWPVTEGVAGALPVPCQLIEGSRVANADSVPRGADGLSEPLPLQLPAAEADAEGGTVSEAAPEETGLPEGPRLALAAPEDDVRPLVVGEGSAVHTVPVGLALARGVLEELALGVPDENTVLLGVCEGVPNGVRVPLGVGVRDSVLLGVGMGVPVCVPEPLGVGSADMALLGVGSAVTVLLGVELADTVLLGVGLADMVLLGVGLGVPVGEPVCVIFGVPVPLGVALSVGHRLTRPPPPAGAL